MCELQTVVFYCTDCIIHLYVHCNFICGLSDVMIKTFSQSVAFIFFLRTDYTDSPGLFADTSDYIRSFNFLAFLCSTFLAWFRAVD